jgi:hypothetical protein
MSDGSASFRARTTIRSSVIASVFPVLMVCNATAVAQVGMMASPTPAVGTTSPLGIGAGPTVPQTGIPLGSTEIASPGISPAPAGATGTISMPGDVTTCSTSGISPSGMFGSTTSFDGGGTAAGSAAPATAAMAGMVTSSGTSPTSGVSTTSGMLDTSGLAGMCGSGSSSVASSSTPTSTSPLTPGGTARTGIPLGSVEIGNLGVSSAAAVPTVGVSPTVGPVPVMAPLPAGSSTAANTMPCPTTGASIASEGC